MSSVSIRNVSVSFGKQRILNDISIEIAGGEFIVLLGPSGCGKSTLLNAIAGLIEIDQGQIWIGDRNVTWEEPKDRGIAMVFQSYALYPRMNVRENMSFGLRMSRMERPKIAERVERAAEMLQITPLLDRRPEQLSGGQRQRVAIGRALVRDADVFLFDEPLSNLDAQLRNELRLEIKRLHKQMDGATVVYVTHDQIEAMTLADRIAVMKDQIIQQFGTPDDIYLHPANMFVAGFVGSPKMNFLEGIIEGGDEAPVFKVSDLRLPLKKCMSNGGLRTGQSVTLGLRPEHIAVDDAGAWPGFKIELIETLGADNLIWCRKGPALLQLRVPGEFRPCVGEPLSLTPDFERLSLFDNATGKRF